MPATSEQPDFLTPERDSRAVMAEEALSSLAERGMATAEGIVRAGSELKEDAAREFRELALEVRMIKEGRGTVVRDLLLGITAFQVLIVTVWAVYFASRDPVSTGIAVSNIPVLLTDTTRAGVVWAVGSVQCVQLASVVYGVVAADRGWLELALLCDIAIMGLLNTHLGVQSIGVRILSLIGDGMLLMSITGIAALERRFQEAELKTGRDMEKHTWCCGDLPDQSAGSLRIAAIGAGFAAVILSFVVLGAPAVELRAADTARGVMVLVSGLLSVCVGVAHSWRGNSTAHIVHIAVFSALVGSLPAVLQQTGSSCATQHETDCDTALATHIAACGLTMACSWLHHRVANKLVSANKDDGGRLTGWFARHFGDDILPPLRLGLICVMPLQAVVAVGLLATSDAFHARDAARDFGIVHVVVSVCVLFVAGAEAVHLVRRNAKGGHVLTACAIALNVFLFSGATLGLDVADSMLSQKGGLMNSVFVAAHPISEGEADTLRVSVAWLSSTCVVQLLSLLFLGAVSDTVQLGWRGGVYRSHSVAPAGVRAVAAEKDGRAAGPLHIPCAIPVDEG